MFADESEFMKVEQVSSLLPPDLDNPILPLFKQANFPGADYDVLKMPLRLASLEIGHAVRQPDSVPRRIILGSQALIPLGEQLGDKDRLIADTFTRLAELVKFRPSNDMNNGGGTECMEHPPGFVPQHPKENTSNVWYSRKMHAERVKCTRSADDPAYLAVLQYLFGTTIAHEAMHALTNAQEYLENAVYYSADANESPIAEIGFEFESRLFGGGHIERLYDGSSGNKTDRILRHQYLNGTDSELSGVMVMWDYPCRNLVEHYQHNGFPIGCRRLVRNTAPGYGIGWRVSVQYISTLLSKAFWETEVSNRSLMALQPPKFAGHFFIVEYPDGDQTQPRWLSSERAARLIPPGFVYSKSYDIVPVPMTAATEQPTPLHTETAAVKRIGGKWMNDTFGDDAMDDVMEDGDSEDDDDRTDDEDCTVSLHTPSLKAASYPPGAPRKDYNAISAAYAERWPRQGRPGNVQLSGVDDMDMEID
ncbi:hypothetical protein LTR85_011741 [Meristemomyces frigidus]|nr:hypothetical protein LTR85_011741 [Meristemomyces frigidus]